MQWIRAHVVVLILITLLVANLLGFMPAVVRARFVDLWLPLGSQTVTQPVPPAAAPAPPAAPVPAPVPTPTAPPAPPVVTPPVVVPPVVVPPVVIQPVVVPPVVVLPVVVQPAPTPPTAAVTQPLLIIGGYDPQIHGYVLPIDPCGFTRFPYIPNPTRWYPGYMIQCRNQRTGALYDKWVPDHYE